MGKYNKDCITILLYDVLFTLKLLKDSYICFGRLFNAKFSY